MRVYRPKFTKKPPLEVFLDTSGAGTELTSGAVTAGNVGGLHHVSFVIISCRVTHSNIKGRHQSFRHRATILLNIVALAKIGLSKV